MDAERRKRLTLVACVLGSAVVFVDTTVVNVALPALREDFDAGLAAQQWVVEAYLLTLSALILVGGSLADVLGRRRILQIGLAGFGITSALAAIAPSVELLVAARALQGVAGALLVPASLAIITATYDEGERGGAIGSWTAWTGVAIVIGPLVGGLLVEAVSWRLVFWINPPLVLVTMWLAHRAVEESSDPEGKRIDVLGGTLAVGGLAGLVLGLVEQPTKGFADPLVWAPLAAGAAALAAFVAHERRTDRPMLPLGLFRRRNFSAANAATLAVYAGLNALTFFTVLYVQQVGDYSAFEAGLALTPTTLMLVFLSRRFGALADRVGPRMLMTAGPLVAAGGALLLLRLGRDADYFTALLPALLVFGLGLAMTVAPLTATVLGAVPQRRAGVASGVNNAAARLAGLLAIAGVGAIVAGAFGAELDERLEAAELGPAAQRVAADAKARPLVPVADGDLPPDDRAVLRPARAEASVDAYHAGMVAVAVLLAVGAAVSAAGVRRAERAEAATQTA